MSRFSTRDARKMCLHTMEKVVKSGQVQRVIRPSSMWTLYDVPVEVKEWTSIWNLTAADDEFRVKLAERKSSPVDRFWQ